MVGQFLEEECCPVFPEVVWKAEVFKPPVSLGNGLFRSKKFPHRLYQKKKKKKCGSGGKKERKKEKKKSRRNNLD